MIEPSAFFSGRSILSFKVIRMFSDSLRDPDLHQDAPAGNPAILHTYGLFVFLNYLVFHTNPNDFRKNMGRPTTFTCLKSAEPSFSVREKGHVFYAFKISAHGFHERYEQVSIFLAATLIDNEAAGSFHNNCCPSFGISGIATPAYSSE